jgi:hypothetical protein
MMNDIDKNELTEQEMTGVSGGSAVEHYIAWKQMEREEEEYRKRDEARRQYEARQEAIRKANEPGAHAHSGGASGGW